jgi:sirohydrochlorin ferrochelatase
VVKDIPQAVQKAGERHPGVTFTVLPHLGKARGIRQLILDEISR